jgi:hypothetical protein
MGAKGTSTTVTQAADPWYKGEATQLFRTGQQLVSSFPYNQYPGQSVAGFQPAQLAAQDYLTRAFLGRSYPYNAPTTYGPFAPPNFNVVGDASAQMAAMSSTSDPNLLTQNEGIGGGGMGGGASLQMASMPSTRNPNLLYWGPSGVEGLDASGNPPPGYPADWQSLMPGKPYPAGMPIWSDSWGPMPSSVLYGGSGQYSGQPVYTTGTPNTPTGLPGTPGVETPLRITPTTPSTPTTPTGTPYTTTYTPYTTDVGITGGAGTGLTEAAQAADIARSIGGGITAPSVSAERAIQGMGFYANPYENQVVSSALSDIERQRQIAANQARSQATMSGAFGGTRSALLEAETNRAYADAAAKTAAQLRSQGFTQEAELAAADANRLLNAAQANQQAYLSGRGQQLQAAGLLSGFGGDIFGRTQGVAGAISNLGAEQQAQAQNVINADIAAYERAVNAPRENLAYLQSLLTGIPRDTSTIAYVPTNRAAGFLGGATAGLGALGQLGIKSNPLSGGIAAGLGGLLGLF